MSFLTFLIPPFPTLIKSGEGHFRMGKKHFKRVFTVFDFIYVTSGKLFMTENGIDYELSKGQYIILIPGLEHFGTKNCTEDTKFHWIHFKIHGEFDLTDNNEINWGNVYLKEGDFVEPPQYHFQIPRTGQVKYTDHLEKYFEYMLGTEKLHTPDSRLRQQIYFEEFLIQLQKEAMSIPSATEGISEMVIAYIQQNYQMDIKMEDLARDLHFHSDYITRCVQKTLGISPIQYLQQYRMSQAKRLLASTNDKVMTISKNIGILDHTYFSKLFKKMEGMTPSEYRQFAQRG
ncbi:helix-turn-helix domain-containing protein [Bacillus timonensis]|nr:helix-turn-helix domain-containing protein [Bacillus timonensis]